MFISDFFFKGRICDLEFVGRGFNVACANSYSEQQSSDLILSRQLVILCLLISRPDNCGSLGL